MAESGYPGGNGFPTLSIMTDHDDPFLRALAHTLQQNLGIEAVQDIEDPEVLSAKIHSVQPRPFVGFYSTGYTGILTWRAERATAVYKEAAAILQRTFEFIPFLYADRVYAIRPGIEGVHLWTGYFTISFKGVRVS